jgi:hypothetical protein
MLAPAMLTLPEAARALDREAAAAEDDAMVLARISLDREVVEQQGTLNGTLRFSRAVSGPVIVQWMDGFGRVVGEQPVFPKMPGQVAASFSFNMRNGLTYANWIRVTVHGVPQVATARFLMSPTWTPWDDFHAIDWARYPDGYYEQLREAGVDATIAYVEEDNSPVLDNNFRFYVEQMAWEVFAIYQKDQTEWRELLARFSRNRKNLELWVRSPCVNDPRTTEYFEKYLPKYVRAYRAFRPLFYDLSDELGQGAQTEPNDFCHSKFCTDKFSDYLHFSNDYAEWDAAHRYPRPEWDKTNILSDTTTDRAFESIALAGFRERYKSIKQFNQAWGTGFNSWAAVSGVIRDTLSARELNAVELEKLVGPLDQANARWGGLAGWSAPNEPIKFANWGQVIAFVNRYYKELGEMTSTRGWNVSAWCTFRNFMDGTFADCVKRAGDICKKEDPHGLIAVEGAQIPSAYGWYNYENVVRSVDVIEIANAGNNIEIARSLDPSIILLTTHDSGGSPDRLQTAEQHLKKEQTEHLVWWDLFHNHRGTVIWDNRLPQFAFVDEKTGKLTASAGIFSDVLHELRAGIGKLFINSERLHDGIAIHYSQPSIQIHWLLDNVKHAREWMLKSVGEYGDFCIAVRNSWTKMIEDLGLQYNFVGSGTITSGGLNSGKYKVFIMPESIAVSPEEVEQIRVFVQAGGTLIADWRAAELNGLGRDLGKGGQLDDVFGIRHGSAQKISETVEGTGNEGPLRLAGKELYEIRVGDPTVALAGGKALAKSGDVPMAVVNRFGAGQAIFLNMEIADYAYLRLQPNSNSSLPEIAESALAMAGVKPRLRVLGPDGKRLRGVEIVRFANGGCEHVAIFRNPETDGDGFGAYRRLLAQGWSKSTFGAAGKIEVDNSMLEKTAEVTLDWAENRETYDIRGRKSLGKLQTQKATLNWWGPLAYTRSQLALAPLRVEVARGARRGHMADITLTNAGPLPGGTNRIVHLEFRTPAGEPYDLYTRNVTAKSARTVEGIPFALNDPKGKWKLSAHDLISGEVVETPFDLA